MKFFKFILFYLLCLNSFFTNAQHKNTKIELKEIEVVSKEISLILEDFIKHEKKCDYYSCNLVFTIRINVDFDSLSIKIESIDDKNIAFELNPYGYFYFENHLFLLYYDKLEPFFNHTKNSKVFDYVEYDIYYKEYTPEGRLILRVINDDSFTQWEYKFLNEKLILINKASFCE